MNWEKGQQIGQGAFSKVYMVYSSNSAQKYACKVAENVENAGKLSKEMEILRGLKHPVFPRYEHFVQEKGCAYLLMEYIDGENLAEFMEGNHPIEQAIALRFAREIAEGLQYMHELPECLIYRDLKPENIMIDRNGRIRIVDLGCACNVEQGCNSMAGSRGYAPREQLEAQNVGCYSDVYAWGKLVHYMLTGDEPCKPPYKKYPLRTYGKQFSPVLEQLLEQCTAENFSERPPSMRSVIRVLDEIDRGKSGKLLSHLMFRRREMQVLLKKLCQRGNRDFCFIKCVCR